MLIGVTMCNLEVIIGMFLCVEELLTEELLQFLPSVNRSHFTVTPNDCFAIADFY